MTTFHPTRDKMVLQKQTAKASENHGAPLLKVTVPKEVCMRYGLIAGDVLIFHGEEQAGTAPRIVMTKKVD